MCYTWKMSKVDDYLQEEGHGSHLHDHDRCSVRGKHCRHHCLDCDEVYCCKCGTVFSKLSKWDRPDEWWKQERPPYLKDPGIQLCVNTHTHLTS